MTQSRSLSTRRGFIAAAGFSVLGLYGAWAYYGAAPLSIFGSGSGADDGGHGGGHSGGDGGLSPEAFERLTEEFIANFRREDGTVQPLAAMSDMPEHDMSQHMDHASENKPTAQATPTEDAHAAQGAVDVYLMARKWSYAPDRLQLEAGQPYRFRMMAMDGAHGAAIHLGNASRVIRLPKHALVETTLTFAKPGVYPVYCTVFCGAGHDRMAGRILVA